MQVRVFETHFNNRDQWFDIDDYGDVDDLIEAIEEFLKEDEDHYTDDEDISSSDWKIIEGEDIPDDIEVTDLKNIFKWKNAIEESNNEDALTVALEYTNDVDSAIMMFEDSYIGEYDSDADFVKEYLSEVDVLPSDLPWYIENNIDWKGVATDIMSDFIEVQGHYFHS